MLLAVRLQDYGAFALCSPGHLSHSASATAWAPYFLLAGSSPHRSSALSWVISGRWLVLHALRHESGRAIGVLISKKPNRRSRKCKEVTQKIQVVFIYSRLCITDVPAGCISKCCRSPMASAWILESFGDMLVVQSGMVRRPRQGLYNHIIIRNARGRFH